MIIFYGFFSVVGLECQCMWLVYAFPKDFNTTYCLSFESSHPFKSLTIESTKMTVTLSYFFTCCCVFYVDGLLDLLVFSLCQNHFIYLSWVCLCRQLPLDLHNPQHYSPFRYHHYLITLGID